LNILRIERDVCLILFDTDAIIRTATPDLRVALASLGKEFDVLTDCYPHDGDGLIIDAGGYIETAAMALAKIYPACTIVTVEPSSRNFDALLKNTKAFTNIRPIKAALTMENGLGAIDLMSRGNGEWDFTTIKKPGDRETSFLESVDTVSIEEILETSGYDRIFVLKMDIEGGEYGFFRSDCRWLEKVDIFLVELHERTIAGCTDAFETCNKNRSIILESGGKVMSISRMNDDLGDARFA
jgi:FkbM family methyltransferase